LNRRSKKQIVTGLLFLACIIAGWLLLSAPSVQYKNLKKISQVDSLLKTTLARYHISWQQVSTRSVQVDSTFSRAIHTINVPAHFPQTEFHLALKHTLSPYDISVPAHVNFPAKNLDIQIYFDNTIIGTIKLIKQQDSLQTSTK